MGNNGATGSVDLRLAEFATGRWAVFTVTDAVNLGVSRRMLTSRVAAGRVFRLHRGVYSVVPPRLLKVHGLWRAAVLAGGPGAALSHFDAAALHRLMRVGSGRIHVTVPTTAGRRRRNGIALHRSSTLLPGQTVVSRHIPATNPARTLSDLRNLVSPSRYESLLREADNLGLDTGLPIEKEPDGTEIERRLLAVCRRHSLALPRTQQVIGPYTVDFIWPEAGVVVETDGYETHGTRSAFESDRARDAWLTARGYRVVRFTWRHLRADPAAVVATLRALLG